jgi:pyridinium-3,5-bisthiocarboxylic acid mononucleotide nickel chelatase
MVAFAAVTSPPQNPCYHLDCSSGLAGDMFLGACLDLGMPLDVLADTVARLALPGVTIESRKAARGGVTGTRFRVLVEGRPVEGPDPEEDPEEAPSHGHHGHPHRHGDEHHPGTETEHAHSHGAGHEHGRDLASIRRLVVESSLTAPVKERAIALFERLGAAEA